MSKKSFDTQGATSKFFTSGTHNKPGTHDTHREKEIPASAFPDPDIIPADPPPRTEDLTPAQLAAIVRQSMQILENTTPKRGRPPKEEKKRGYRYNLNLDKDLQQYLKETAWRERTSITQYINDLIRADMKAYFARCEAAGIDPKEGWEQDDN